jgi:IS605 OrfB family transposase
MTKELSGVRVIELKTDLRKDQFWDRYERCFKTYHALYNEVPCWGLDWVEQKTQNQTSRELGCERVDLTAQRKALYERTDRTISYEQFSNCLKALWLGLLNCQQGNHMYTKLFEGAIQTDQMTAEDWAVLTEYVADPKSHNSQFLFRVSNTLKHIGFFSRPPFTATLFAPERKAITKDVMSDLKSWIEMKRMTEESYAAEEVQIQQMKAEVPVRIRQSLLRFFDTCIGLNLIGHFDERVHHYLRDCIIPALQQRTIPTEHFYLKSNRKDVGQKHIDFSLDIKFYELLAEMPELWNTLETSEDDLIPKPLILKHLHLLEAIMSHRAHRKTAAYAFVGEADYHRFYYLLGGNYTKHLISATGSELPDRVIWDNDKDVLMRNGRKVERLYVKVGDRKENFNFEVYTIAMNTKGLRGHRSTLKPTSYLQDLQIWSNPEGESTYLNFVRKGTERSAICKEPVLVYRNGAFFLRLSMSVEGMRASEEHIALQYYLSAAATGSDLSKDTEKTVERFNLIQGKTYKVMSVDLGIRSPFAWAVTESTITGVANPSQILNSGEMEIADDPDYTELFYAYKNLGHLIGQVKSSSKGKGLKADSHLVDMIHTVQRFFADYKVAGQRRSQIFEQFSKDPDPLYQMDQMMKRYENNLESVKKDFSFLINILFKYVTLQFGALRNRRRSYLSQNQMADQKFDQDFKWLNILEQRKRVTRSLSYLGTDNSRIPICLEQQKLDYNGCKDNFLKQLASKIVRIAHQNDCCLIVLEDLEGYGKTLNQRDENFLTAFWSPKRVKDAIINAAQWYGIGVVTVSEAQTSQVHHESGRIGYRKGRDLFFLTPDGQIESVPSDINAAKNIGHRFFSRHTDLHQVYLKGSDEGAKRMKGCLLYQFGSLEAARTHLTGTGPTWYLDGVEWIDKTERNLRRDLLKQRVEIEKMPF